MSWRACTDTKEELAELTEEQKQQLGITEEAAQEKVQEPVPATQPPAEKAEETIKKPAGEEVKEEVKETPKEKPKAAEEKKEGIKPIVEVKSEEKKEEKAEEIKKKLFVEEAADLDEKIGAGGLEELIDPENYFKLHDGNVIKTLPELKEYLKDMNEDLFHEHVGEGYNHFADWIEFVFMKPDLAKEIRGLEDKNKIAEAL
ncbi:hypothetical protein ACFL1B_04435 [Nanoarchaeota archaeon]